MRVVVVGATGNVGTSLVRALADDPGVDSILGVARRRPDLELAKTEWAEADVADSDLRPLFDGADAVVHLAWLIQPSRDRNRLWRVNVEGSFRLFRATAEAGVPVLVYASSVGAYSPGPKDRFVDESWAVGGVRTSFYSRHKAEVERRLDAFERGHPDLRVVRLRPALIFKREAATGIRRLFAGPFLPGGLMRPGLVPLVPDIPELRFQAVHSLDVGEAYRLAITREVRGAFNVAADPVLDSAKLAELLQARLIRVPPRAARAAAAVACARAPCPAAAPRTRGPASPAARAAGEGAQAFLELLEGMREGAGEGTPPLAPETSGPLRIREFLTGVGRKPGA